MRWILGDQVYGVLEDDCGVIPEHSYVFIEASGRALQISGIAKGNPSSSESTLGNISK